MNIDAKTLNKLFTKQIQQHIKKSHIPQPSWIHSRITRMIQHTQINQCDTKLFMTKCTYNLILNGEKLNTFPLKSGIRMPILTTTLQHSIGSSKHSKQRRNYRNSKWWGEVKSLSRVQLCDPMTIAYRALPPMGFSRQEYWSGLSFPSPEDLPDPGIELRSPAL